MIVNSLAWEVSLEVAPANEFKLVGILIKSQVTVENFMNAKFILQKQYHKGHKHTRHKTNVSVFTFFIL